MNTQSSFSEFQSRTRRVNWPLWVGIILVAFTLLLAVQGPAWAPQNPMKENYILRVNGKVISPPYPPLMVPGYWLGTDNFGRDTFSRILWGVRPTMIMVITVAGVRLILGLLIGLTAGWFTGRVGRALETAISWALALPVLLVALAGIAAVGIEKGLWAFVIGLALNGWAETARLVREQTRTIKQQAYIEAAQALGATDTQILSSHVLRQILPLAWMLWAFEISGTLLVSAELGFLGYYIGGGVWMEITDFHSVNVAGLPELGQMLSIALTKLTDPSGLIVMGSILFLTIMGFNLLGEGLRLQWSPENTRSHRRFFFLRNAFGDWVETVASPAIFGWVEVNRKRLWLVAGLAVMAIGGFWWWDSQPARQTVNPSQWIRIPGNHLWATERHDAQGTRWTAALGPRAPQIIWQTQVDGGISGGPVVTADGTVILAGLNGALMAFDRSGKQLWRVLMEQAPVGTPALGENGNIYIADQGGGLTAFKPDGAWLWWIESQTGRQATSGPIVGANGAIYYTLVDTIQAVAPDGQPLWKSPVSTSFLETPPRLSAGGAYLFIKNAALAAANGAPLNLTGLPLDDPQIQYTDPTFVVGADSLNYLRGEHGLMRWHAIETGAAVDKTVQWNPQGSVPLFPWDAGVTPDGLMWLFYTNEFSDTRLVWLDAQNKILGNTRLAERNSRLVAIDGNATATVCSTDLATGELMCLAVPLGASEPAWKINMKGKTFAGAALVDGRVYVASQEGDFFALGDAP